MDLGSWAVDRQGVSEKHNHILWLDTCFLREICIVGVGGHRGVNSGGSLGL